MSAGILALAVIYGLLGIVLLYVSAFSINMGIRILSVSAGLIVVILVELGASYDAFEGNAENDTFQTGVYTVRVCDRRVEPNFGVNGKKNEHRSVHDCILKNSAGEYVRYLFSADRDRDNPNRQGTYAEGATIEFYELDGKTYIRERSTAQREP